MRKTDPAIIDGIHEHARLHPEDTYSQIARRFGVSKITVQRICADLGRAKGRPKGKTSATRDSERFWSRVSKNGNQCWPWTGSKNNESYGFISIAGKSRPAHQVAYELTKGPIPKGLEIDHLCGNRGCCNPDHLEAVTRRENMIRARIIPSARRIAVAPRATGTDTEQIIDTPFAGHNSISESVVPSLINGGGISTHRTDTSSSSIKVSVNAGANFAGMPKSVTSQELIPTPLLLQKKTHPRNNIIVGADPAQIRFMERELGVKCQEVDRVTDDMLLGNEEGLLFRVYATHRIDLSPEMRSKTGFWSAEPIVKGSAAINALVKFAATLLPNFDKKLTRELVDLVGDRLTKDPILDIYATLWAAAALLNSDIKPSKPWKEPWEAPVGWLDESMNIDERLGWLYKRLVGYAAYLGKGEEAARKTGLTPAQVQKLKDLKIDLTKAYETLRLLSQWKQGQWHPSICAMQISAVWQ